MADTLSGISTLNGTPAQARVTLVNSDTNAIVSSQLSNATTGAWEFTGLPAGTYEVVQLIDGYRGRVDGPWALDGVGTDPHYADVFSLLNFSGADGSTTFTDEKGIAWTAMGNAQIDTSLGYNTGLFDGTGDYIKTAATANFSGGPFCIEQWLYVIASPGLATYLACQDDGAADNQNFQFVLTTSRTLQFVGWTAASRGSVWTLAGASVIPLATLTHVAVDYDGTTTRMFINGTLEASNTTTHWAGSLLPVTIGSFLDGPNDEAAFARYNGHIRASRMTLASRYTSDFTPPPAPFPTSA